MSEPLCLGTTSTALLLMDYQRFVLDNFLPADMVQVAVANASRLIKAARVAGILVIHVQVGFRPGYPEISPRNQTFSWLKGSGLVTPGGDGNAFHIALAPAGDEIVVVKHRVGAFGGTDLERILRAKGIETLLIAGVTTSGVVLSTVCAAVDLDYRLIVAGDACADAETAVHELLLRQVLPSRATVLATNDIAQALARPALSSAQGETQSSSSG